MSGWDSHFIRGTEGIRNVLADPQRSTLFLYKFIIVDWVYEEKIWMHFAHQLRFGR